MSESIQRLRELRGKAENINATLHSDLKPFFVKDHLVFRRLPTSDPYGNITTTCSCLMSLITSKRLIDFIKTEMGFSGNDEDEKAKKYIAEMFEHGVNGDWNSSGLSNVNAFSSLIVLRTAGMLLKSHSIDQTKPVLEMVHPTQASGERDRQAQAQPAVEAKIAVESLKEMAFRFAEGAPESFRVEGYPSTPAIAYWFVDAIENLKLELDDKYWRSIISWVSETFSRHVSLVTSQHDAMKDPIQMAMAACLATKMRRIVASEVFKEAKKLDAMIKLLPTDIEVKHAILRAFEHQEKSGIWPKYFPLFNYKKEGVGSNYFFSFELLEVIVEEFENSDLLENNIVLNGIEQALTWCENNRLIYKHDDETYEGWNSGGQITTLSEGKPESWATAVIHMFLRKLRSALSLLIEKHILAKYRASHVAKIAGRNSKAWDDYIDSPLELQSGESTEVKKLIEKEILIPLQKATSQGINKINHRRSALLFGPPGTAKTSLVRAIAKKMNGPWLNSTHLIS